jgi:hypothetical protein
MGYVRQNEKTPRAGQPAGFQFCKEKILDMPGGDYPALARNS